MLLHEAQRYLNSFVNYEAKLPSATPEKFNLKRVDVLLEKLGNPHKKLHCIHVAGTNGKGSVCAMSASILQYLGFKVGLYTSPHLWDMKERIRVLDPSLLHKKERGLAGQIAEEDFCAILEDMRPSIENVRQQPDLGELTFFEIMTVAAFCYFYQQEVDYVVLETGLGGRLDATNVVQAQVCGLTPISLEHTQQLGDTLFKIAAEKAAVIKNSKQKVIIASQSAEAMNVISDHCAVLGIRPVVVGQDVRYQLVKQDEKGLTCSVKTPQNEYVAIRSPLSGAYQMINIATAIAMIEMLLGPRVIDQEKLKEGIRHTQWPGRFEIIGHQPAIILDGAHNPAAVQELVSNIKEIFFGRKVILILGMSADKDRTAIARALEPLSECIILTKSQHARSLAPEELKDLFKQKEILTTQTVPEAMELALQKAQKDDVIVVAGSLFVVGEARKYL